MKTVSTATSTPDEIRARSASSRLLSAAEGADALFITPADRLDSGFFQKGWPTIKIIATYSAGFEHIDLEAAARRKISVSYTPSVNHEATADIAMLFGASRRAYEAQELLRTGTWRPLSPDMLLGWQVGGKILGIFGMGRVGQALAHRARGFGMKIHYCNTSELPAEIGGDAVYHKDPSDPNTPIMAKKKKTPTSAAVIDWSGRNWLPFPIDPCDFHLVNDEDEVIRTTHVACS